MKTDDRRVGDPRGAPRARPGRAGAEPRSAGPSAREKAAGDRDGFVKLFVNRGERSGITEEDLRWALREGALVPEDAIHGVRVLHRFSFVELDRGRVGAGRRVPRRHQAEGTEIRLEVARS